LKVRSTIKVSGKLEDFYELELNVKVLNNLEETFDDYLSIEHLQGENKYLCESCKSHVDATRCIKLCSLPPTLNFQLKQCVFLEKVMLVTSSIDVGVMFQFKNYFIIMLVLEINVYKMLLE